MIQQEYFSLVDVMKEWGVNIGAIEQSCKKGELILCAKTFDESYLAKNLDAIIKLKSKRCLNEVDLNYYDLSVKREKKEVVDYFKGLNCSNFSEFFNKHIESAQNKLTYSKIKFLNDSETVQYDYVQLLSWDESNYFKDTIGLLENAHIKSLFSSHKEIYLCLAKDPQGKHHVHPKDKNYIKLQIKDIVIHKDEKIRFENATCTKKADETLKTIVTNGGSQKHKAVESLKLILKTLNEIDPQFCKLDESGKHQFLLQGTTQEFFNFCKWLDKKTFRNGKHKIFTGELETFRDEHCRCKKTTMKIVKLSNPMRSMQIKWKKIEANKKWDQICK
jgi:hypothetical protein